MTITGKSVISGTSLPNRLSPSKSMNVCCAANAYYTKVRGDLDDAIATGKGLFGFSHHVHEASQSEGSEGFPVSAFPLSKEVLRFHVHATEVSHRFGGFELRSSYLQDEHSTKSSP